MAVFDWMEPAKEEVNSSSEFRKLGSVDIRLAFKSGKHCNLVHFHGFEVGDIKSLDPDLPFSEAEVMVEMSTRNWNSYMKQRAIRTTHSLQSVDVDKSIISASNPLKRRLFERYQRSIQAFVDAGAQWNARRANL
ncbi:MAG: hypothetical protein OXC80_00645 [Gammaproteobacteria bacterium]|nr:hypothetical protein [Gammaproteobacteria bacterium]